MTKKGLPSRAALSVGRTYFQSMTLAPLVVAEKFEVALFARVCTEMTLGEPELKAIFSPSGLKRPTALTAVSVPVVRLTRRIPELSKTIALSSVGEIANTLGRERPTAVRVRMVAELSVLTVYRITLALPVFPPLE